MSSRNFLYEGNFWRSSKDCSSSAYEPSPLIHNCIFKERLFKKQLHSNYLPFAVSSHTSLTTGIAVLISYDTILTLPAEIQFVWKSRIRLPSVLYIIARYFALIEFICSVVLDLGDGSLEVRGEAGPKMLPRLIAVDRHVMLWMDVRGNTGKGLRYKQTSEIPFNTDIVNISRRTFLPCVTAGTVLTITFDGLILFTTLFYTIGTIRLQRDIKALRKRSITYLIVQQGVLRFVISAKFVSTSFLGIGNNMENWQVFIAFIISTLLICRFFLDVRELNSSCAAINPTNSLMVTTFRAAVRSIGNSLIEDVRDANYTGDFIPSAPHEGELPVHSEEGCEEAYGGERVEGHDSQKGVKCINLTPISRQITQGND
ncbi:hypothetical protein BU17DRAFT_68613 [Hysterangium stoloniferum]|nr:hypothetical protein BU17DRAFT_68613 [Hysterangium stoloniferum]